MRLRLCCALALAAAGCSPGERRTAPRPRPEAAPAAPAEALAAPVSAAATLPVDTQRGTITVVGSMPATQVVLRPRDGGAAVLLAGPELAQLKRLAGAEVWVAGKMLAQERGTEGERPPPAGSRRLEVHSFAVRAVEGAAAFDGILLEDGAGLALLLADGRKLPLAHAPATLRDWLGARIWVAAPANLGSGAFGLIRPRP